MPIEVVNEEKVTDHEVAAAKQLEQRMLDEVSDENVPSDMILIKVKGDGELDVECNHPGAKTRSFTKQIPSQLLPDAGED